MNSKTMSQAEYAAYRGVRKSAVSNWKKAGLLIFAEDTQGKLKVDVARSDARVNANIDPTRGRPTVAAATAAAAPVPSGAGDTGEEAKVRSDLIREQTISRRLANARDAKELVPFAEAEALAAEGGRLARERMHALLRSHAERLAAERDPRQVVSFFGGEIDRAFDELAAQMAKGMPEDDVTALDTIEEAEIAAEAEAEAPASSENEAAA